MRRLLSLVIVLTVAGCFRSGTKKPVYPESIVDSTGMNAQARRESREVVLPEEKGPVDLDQKTEPIPPVDVDLSGRYKLAEPPIGRQGPGVVAAEAPEPTIVLPEKKEEPKVVMVPPPEEKPVAPPPIIRGEGVVQAIFLDKDTYRQGEVATLNVTAVLPLDNARIEFLYRGYKLYPTPERTIYKTVLAVPMETKPDSYFMTISYDEGAERKSLQLPFKVVPGEFAHRDTAKLDIPILTEETSEMLKYEGGYFANAYRTNPDSALYDGEFIWPCSGTIAGLYATPRRYNKDMDKWRHKGVDIGNAVGASVVAPNDGVVSMAKSLDVHGKSIVIAHGGGVHTVYLHLSRIFVAKGERVKKGQVIGLVGKTGLCTGPNLHWQVMVNGVATDPRYWVKGGTELRRRDYVKPELAGTPTQ